MTYAYIVVLSWLLLSMLLLWWATRRGLIEPQSPPPEPDPYEGQIREWRRAVHDWTRDN